MPNVTMKEMLEAGAHFGHQTNHWNPRMKPYVFGARNGIYIIDLQQTVDYTKKACEFLKNVTAEGKKVLFVGTKKQAKEVIKDEALRSQMYFVNNRWLGGMLTNYQTVKASIDRLKKLEALKESEEWNDYSRKIQSKYDRELEKLQKSLGGIQEMKKLPGALVVIDTAKEHIAIKEAKKLGIPTVAVVDTNCDPRDVDYVIPGNDDAIRSVKLFSRLLADSCIEGTRVFEEKLRSNQVTQEDEEGEEKKVSKFEGDIDLQTMDEADLAVQEIEEELKAKAAEADPAEVVVEGVTVKAVESEESTEN
ncbi:MAG: 30S ribosomal protein S2 [Bdellovibrionaceae bacterium]|nr:30S ribosomal protein S2 [Pseudobdellovibrionaceae bacterium]